MENRGWGGDLHSSHREQGRTGRGHGGSSANSSRFTTVNGTETREKNGRILDWGEAGRAGGAGRGGTWSDPSGKGDGKAMGSSARVPGGACIDRREWGGRGGRGGDRGVGWQGEATRGGGVNSETNKLTWVREAAVPATDNERGWGSHGERVKGWKCQGSETAAGPEAGTWVGGSRLPGGVVALNDNAAERGDNARGAGALWERERGAMSGGQNDDGRRGQGGGEREQGWCGRLGRGRDRGTWSVGGLDRGRGGWGRGDAEAGTGVAGVRGVGGIGGVGDQNREAGRAAWNNARGGRLFGDKALSFPTNVGWQGFVGNCLKLPDTTSLPLALALGNTVSHNPTQLLDFHPLSPTLFPRPRSGGQGILGVGPGPPSQLLTQQLAAALIGIGGGTGGVEIGGGCAPPPTIGGGCAPPPAIGGGCAPPPAIGGASIDVGVTGIGPGIGRVQQLSDSGDRGHTGHQDGLQGVNQGVTLSRSDPGVTEASGAAALASKGAATGGTSETGQPPAPPVQETSGDVVAGARPVGSGGGVEGAPLGAWQVLIPLTGEVGDPARIDGNGVFSEGRPAGGWMYQDLQGVLQGPFPLSQLKQWLHEGHFRPDYPVRREGVEVWVELAKADSPSVVPLSIPMPLIHHSLGSAQFGADCGELKAEGQGFAMLMPGATYREMGVVSQPEHLIQGGQAEAQQQGRQANGLVGSGMLCGTMGSTDGTMTRQVSGTREAMGSIADGVVTLQGPPDVMSVNVLPLQGAVEGRVDGLGNGDAAGTMDECRGSDSAGGHVVEMEIDGAEDSDDFSKHDMIVESDCSVEPLPLPMPPPPPPPPPLHREEEEEEVILRQKAARYDAEGSEKAMATEDGTVGACDQAEVSGFGAIHGPSCAAESGMLGVGPEERDVFLQQQQEHQQVDDQQQVQEQHPVQQQVQDQAQQRVQDQAQQQVQEQVQEQQQQPEEHEQIESPQLEVPTRQGLTIEERVERLLGTTRIIPGKEKDCILEALRRCSIPQQLEDERYDAEMMLVAADQGFGELGVIGSMFGSAGRSYETGEEGQRQGDSSVRVAGLQFCKCGVNRADGEQVEDAERRLGSRDSCSRCGGVILENGTGGLDGSIGEGESKGVGGKVAEVRGKEDDEEGMEDEETEEVEEETEEDDDKEPEKKYHWPLRGGDWSLIDESACHGSTHDEKALRHRLHLRKQVVNKGLPLCLSDGSRKEVNDPRLSRKAPFPDCNDNESVDEPPCLLQLPDWAWQCPAEDVTEIDLEQVAEGREATPRQLLIQASSTPSQIGKAALSGQGAGMGSMGAGAVQHDDSQGKLIRNDSRNKAWGAGGTGRVPPPTRAVNRVGGTPNKSAAGSHKSGPMACGNTRPHPHFPGGGTGALKSGAVAHGVAATQASKGPTTPSVFLGTSAAATRAKGIDEMDGREIMMVVRRNALVMRQRLEGTASEETLDAARVGATPNVDKVPEGRDSETVRDVEQQAGSAPEVDRRVDETRAADPGSEEKVPHMKWVRKTRWAGDLPTAHVESSVVKLLADVHTGSDVAHGISMTRAPSKESFHPQVITDGKPGGDAGDDGSILRALGPSRASLCQFISLASGKGGLPPVQSTGRETCAESPSVSDRPCDGCMPNAVPTPSRLVVAVGGATVSTMAVQESGPGAGAMVLLADQKPLGVTLLPEEIGAEREIAASGFESKPGGEWSEGAGARAVVAGRDAGGGREEAVQGEEPSQRGEQVPKPREEETCYGPEFLKFACDKLHSHVMKSYSSHVFLAAIDDALGRLLESKGKLKGTAGSGKCGGGGALRTSYIPNQAAGLVANKGVAGNRFGSAEGGAVLGTQQTVSSSRKLPKPGRAKERDREDAQKVLSTPKKVASGAGHASGEVDGEEPGPPPMPRKTDSSSILRKRRTVTDDDDDDGLSDGSRNQKRRIEVDPCSPSCVDPWKVSRIEGREQVESGGHSSPGGHHHLSLEVNSHGIDVHEVQSTRDGRDGASSSSHKPDEALMNHVKVHRSPSHLAPMSTYGRLAESSVMELARPASPSGLPGRNETVKKVSGKGGQVGSTLDGSSASQVVTGGLTPDIAEHRPAGWAQMKVDLLVRCFCALRGDPKAVAQAMSTCKRWREAAQISKPNSDRLNLSSLNADCSDELLELIQSFGLGELKRVTLRGCVNLSSDAVQRLLQSHKTINWADIRGCPQLECLVQKEPHIHWVTSHSAAGVKKSKSRLKLECGREGSSGSPNLHKIGKMAESRIAHVSGKVPRVIDPVESRGSGGAVQSGSVRAGDSVGRMARSVSIGADFYGDGAVHRHRFDDAGDAKGAKVLEMAADAKGARARDNRRLVDGGAVTSGVAGSMRRVLLKAAGSKTCLAGRESGKGSPSGQTSIDSGGRFELNSMFEREVAEVLQRIEKADTEGLLSQPGKDDGAGNHNKRHCNLAVIAKKLAAGQYGKPSGPQDFKRDVGSMCRPLLLGRNPKIVQIAVKLSTKLCEKYAESAALLAQPAGRAVTNGNLLRCGQKPGKVYKVGYAGDHATSRKRKEREEERFGNRHSLRHARNECSGSENDECSERSGSDDAWLASDSQDDEVEIGMIDETDDEEEELLSSEDDTDDSIEDRDAGNVNDASTGSSSPSSSEDEGTETSWEDLVAFRRGDRGHHRGNKMHKAAMVPPITRKYTVVEEYVFTEDREVVEKKLAVKLPRDYEDRVKSLNEMKKRCGEDGFVHDDGLDGLPEVKPFQPRKHVNVDVIEQEVYGIDSATYNLLLDIMPNHIKDFHAEETHCEFIEERLLRVLNQEMRDFTGTGKAPDQTPLESLVEKIMKDAERSGDKPLQDFCQCVCNGIREQEDEKPVAWRKGLGVVCNRAEGFPKDDFVVEFFGEVYPPWRWYEKQDGIRKIRTQNKDTAVPEFYNILLERPKADVDGYDLLVVDAMHRANFASRLCHSCRPNCEAKVVAVNNKYIIGVYALRDIQYGEELTFDYNSVTESVEEYNNAVCLCGMRQCKGSFFNLSNSATYKQVIAEKHSILDRHKLLLSACRGEPITLADKRELEKAGFRDSVLSGLPSWAVKYAANVAQFIHYEKATLPRELIKQNAKQKKKSFAFLDDDAARENAEHQAEGTYAIRLQSLATTLDKVRYCLRKLFKDRAVSAPPPIRPLGPLERLDKIWRGEDSVVRGLLRSMAQHVSYDYHQELSRKVCEREPSEHGDVEADTKRALLWLRDELAQQKCGEGCRHDAAADLMHIYAYTKCFFTANEYAKFYSPPVMIHALDLGLNPASGWGDVPKETEFTKSYPRDYIWGQLVFWFKQTVADPGHALQTDRRGFLVLPDPSSCYAKKRSSALRPSYGAKCREQMLQRLMAGEKLKPWPKPDKSFWKYKSHSLYGSPFFDAVFDGKVDEEMVDWLRNRKYTYSSPYDDLSDGS
ncbi:hypothetical protein CBR_g54148 [Chara braunii]|uniref:GYF domain-containing protein n=1 Tax=Chara braunii TaxID=69332 RepID=A0A388MBS9_CHABU|nr:hypothetical protein CBR_g54148 [Chara braunii]|eukprot:GBG92028.1 hypothetical protein CBR_g54148 [Chara braunii]